MVEEQSKSTCQLCGAEKNVQSTSGFTACSTCRTIISNVKNHPEAIKKIWSHFHDEPIVPEFVTIPLPEPQELPDVVDGKRYRTVDRDQNKWYLSVSEIEGNPVEVFASTAFDRNHELQSRISNLTTITRLISLILRHIYLHEPLTMDKCLKQIQRSSRQKNDLPDMLYGVLNLYHNDKEEENNDRQVS